MREVNSRLSKSKKQKASNVVNGGDGISNLPDSILHHIFSFIDIVYAVRASVLSSRWRNLWKSLPHLNFHWEEIPGRESALVGFVNKVLILREKSVIHSLRVNAEDERDVPHVPLWVLIAIGGNVKEMDIFMFSEMPWDVPRCLFTCKSLTVLKLSLGMRNPELTLPDSIILPNLKVLHLRECSLVGLKAASNLISSCPSLESLLLREFQLYEAETFVINSLTLKSLVIENGPNVGEWDPEWIYKVYAPELRTFRCDELMSRDFCFGNLPLLDFADIRLQIEEDGYNPLEGLEKEYFQRMTRILGAVGSVESLILPAVVLMVCSFLFLLEKPIGYGLFMIIEQT